MKKIISRANPEVKEVHALHQAKHRSNKKLFIGQGTRVCSTLLASPAQLKQLYVTEELLSAATNLVSQDMITVVTDPVMEKMSSLTTPPGILGVFSIPEELIGNQINNGIVLYEISDPGNMGTLIRSAAAMNIKSVILCKGVDPWSPKVVQASAGTIGLVHLFQWEWSRIIQLKPAIQLAALTIDGKRKPEEIRDKNILLITGSEAHGIPKTVLADCDETITIPMPGNIESLNAAVAGSIALYLVFMQ